MNKCFARLVLIWILGSPVKCFTFFLPMVKLWLMGGRNTRFGKPWLVIDFILTRSQRDPTNKTCLCAMNRQSSYSGHNTHTPSCPPQSNLPDPQKTQMSFLFAINTPTNLCPYRWGFPSLKETQMRTIGLSRFTDSFWSEFVGSLWEGD